MADTTLFILSSDQETSEVLRTFLSARGYVVTIATSGEKGLERAKAEQAAIIIVDDTLSDMSAYDLIAMLRADSTTASIPILVLTERGARANKIAGLTPSFNIITKPFDLEEVHLLIKNALRTMPGLTDEEHVGKAFPEAGDVPDWLRAEPESPAFDSGDDDEDASASAGAVPTQPAGKPVPPLAPPSIQRPQPGTSLTEAEKRVSQERAPQRDREEASTDARTIQFSAYHPREVVPHEWKPRVAYVYRASAEGDVQADAGKQLGALLSGFRKLTQAARGLINEGTTITATPTLRGFQFNPPSVTLAFYEKWHRFDFKLRAHGAPLYQAANGLLTFTVEGLIVGDVPLSIFVAEKAQEKAAPPNQVSSKIYNAVFCSYSRKDTQVVQRVERAYKALGMDYLRDMTTLRSGEHWGDELKALISRADIFQLFWSPASADSDHVRMEWEYALTLNRDYAGFIRPVYWSQPIPSVPDALKHLHFAYQPDLVD
jgi:CheY-like chemotaxis protein